MAQGTNFFSKLFSNISEYIRSFRRLIDDNRKLVLLWFVVLVLVGVIILNQYTSIQISRFFAFQPGECTVNSDCNDGNVCTQDICRRIPGQGGVCENNAIPACVPPTPTPTATPRHFECVSSACVLVDGPGNNRCNPIGTSCLGGTPTPSPTPTLSSSPEPSVSSSPGPAPSGPAPTPTVSHPPGGTPSKPILVAARCAGTPGNISIYTEWRQPPNAVLNVLQRSVSGGTLQTIVNQTTKPFATLFYVDKALPKNSTLAYRIKSGANVFIDTIAFSIDAAGNCSTAGGTPTPTPTSTSTPGPSVTVTPSATATPIISAAPTTLHVAAVMRNATKSGGFADNIFGEPNDVLEVSITVSADGDAQTVRLLDQLPFGLTYISGSTVIESAPAANGITETGLTVGDLPAGRVVTVRLQVKVADSTAFSSGSTVVPNTITAAAVNAEALTDSAFVTVAVSSGGEQQLNLLVRGRDLTKHESDEREKLNVAPGDLLEVILHIKALQGTVSGIFVTDALPSGVSYIPGSTTVDAIPAADTIILQGLPLNSLAQGQEHLVRFQVQVAPSSALPSGTRPVINTAQIQATGVSPFIAQLAITIFNGGIAGAGQLPTGASANVFIMAALIAGVITCMYVAYTRTSMFTRRELESLIQKDIKRNNPNFKG